MAKKKQDAKAIARVNNVDRFIIDTLEDLKSNKGPARLAEKNQVPQGLRQEFIARQRGKAVAVQTIMARRIASRMNKVDSDSMSVFDDDTIDLPTDRKAAA